MSIKRFFAKTTRDALHMVRDALGPDGAIISNRAVDGGIEILALGPDDITALMPARAEEGAEAASIPGSETLEAGPLGEPPVTALKQAHAVDPSAKENVAERGARIGTGPKDLPRLHFPVLDGSQEQQVERWIIPHLSAESPQAKSRVLSGTNRVKAMPELLDEDERDDPHMDPSSE